MDNLVIDYIKYQTLTFGDPAQKEMLKKIEAGGESSIDEIASGIHWVIRNGTSGGQFSNAAELCLSLARIGGSRARKVLSDIVAIQTRIGEFEFIRGAARHALGTLDGGRRQEKEKEDIQVKYDPKDYQSIISLAKKVQDFMGDHADEMKNNQQAVLAFSMDVWYGNSPQNANLREADLSNIQLTHAVFKNANLSGANLNKAWGFFPSFRNADLTGVKMTNSICIVSPDFKDAKLRNADFSGSKLLGLIMEGDWSGAKFVNSVLVIVGVVGTPNLKGADFTGCRVQFDTSKRVSKPAAFLNCLSSEQQAQLEIQSTKQWWQFWK